METKETYTIRVCQCCILCHANGECCTEDHVHEPLGAIDAKDGLAMGLAAEEHSEECDVYKTGSHPVDYECDCEHFGFSWSSCDGCGSPLGGDRYAMTVFPNERV